MLTRHEYLLRSLRAHNIRHGQVLVLGHDPGPLTGQLEALGFSVQGFTLIGSLSVLRDTGAKENAPEKAYDIIILDDILQYLSCPRTALRAITKQLTRGGILIIASPNVARASNRLRALTGKNLYPPADGNELCDSFSDDRAATFYREYTLDEIRYLLARESFVVIDAGFFRSAMATGQNNPVLGRAYQLLQSAIPAFRNYLFILSRGNFTDSLPTITKDDPFKLKSMHVFNSKWISTYEATPWFKQLFISRWDESVLAHLPGNISSLRILDIGCGWGRLLTSLADAGARNLAGMDLAPRMVDLVRQRLAERGIHAELKAGDAEDAIPWEDGAFDVITLTGSFHHLYRPHDALQEIRRVLRKNGLLIIADPFFFTPVRQIMNYLCSFKAADGDYRFYTAHEVSEIVASAGFTLSQEKQSVNSLLVTALKPS